MTRLSPVIQGNERASAQRLRALGSAPSGVADAPGPKPGDVIVCTVVSAVLADGAEGVDVGGDTEILAYRHEDVRYVVRPVGGEAISGIRGDIGGVAGATPSGGRPAAQQGVRVVPAAPGTPALLCVLPPSLPSATGDPEDAPRGWRGALVILSETLGLGGCDETGGAP